MESQKPVKVLVVEPSGSGHHMALYVRHVFRKLFQEGCSISLLTTRSACEHPSYRLVEAEVKGVFHLYYLPEIQSNSSTSSLSLLSSQLRCWATLRNTFHRIAETNPPDIVYVPTLDWIAKAVEILGSPFGSVKFAALYMSPKHHRKAMDIGPASRQDWIYDKLFERLLKNPMLHRLLVVDELFYEFCVNRYDALLNKILYAPDFGELCGNDSNNLGRKDLGISPNAISLLVYGSLTLRKGIKQLLDAAADPRVPNELTILLAGKPDKDIMNYLETKPAKDLISSGKVLTRLFFHNVFQEYLVFASSSFVWLGYVSGFFGSSGVLYQSVRAGLPIVGMKEGLIGKLIERHSLGIRIDPGDKESIVNGLIESCAIFKERVPPSEEFKTFAAQHTSTKHSEKVFEALTS